MSLRTRLVIAFLLLQMVLIGLFVQLSTSAAVRTQREQEGARERVLVNLARGLAEGLADHHALLQVEIDRICLDQSVVTVTVTDAGGETIARCDADGAPAGEAGTRRRTSNIDADGRLGALAITFSDQEFARGIRARFFGLGTAGILFALVSAFLFGTLLTRRLRKLSETAVRVTAGDTAARVPIDGSDEIADLSRGFNAMLDSLDRGRASLADTHRRVAAVLSTAPDAIVTIDEGGIIQDANDATTRLFGYPLEALVGHNVRMLMPPPYREQHDDYLKRYRDSGEARIIGIGREVEGLKRDGTIFPIRLSVGEAQTGTARFFTGVIHDLSEREHAEGRASRLGTILEDSLNEIFIFDGETLRFTLANEGARRNLGYSMAELERLTPIDIKPEFTRETFEELLLPLRRGELPKLHFKSLHRRKDGSDYRVDVHLQYRNEDDEFVAIILDITERAELEQQLLQAQKMESIGTLAGGVAHDFNNLLTSILGSSQVLLDKIGGDPRLVKAARRIHMAAERGAGLTAQLLAFSRSQVTQPEAIEFNRAIQNARELFIRMISEDIEVKMTLDPGAGTICFDPGQLDQVVINLVVNARDAMPNGGQLELRTGIADVTRQEADRLGLEEGRFTTLVVEDTGIGMSEDTQARIFDPFFTTKEPGKGTGLGLATVHGILQRQAGAIAVTSREGRGTRFTLYFPRVNASARLAKDGVTEAPPVDGSGKAILVVEDDALMRELMIEVLETEGFEVLEAENPETALQLARERERAFDLVITDVVMPQMSGFDLASELGAKSAELKVLFMSGYTDQVLADRGQLRPEDAFLRKPFGNDELLTKVRGLLS